MPSFADAFTKLALNRAKLLALAKRHGIVADDATPWKWAVRQMTDVKDKAGNVLKKGRTREQMGAPPEALLHELAKRTKETGLEHGASYRLGKRRHGPITGGTSNALLPRAWASRLNKAGPDPRKTQRLRDRSVLARERVAPNFVHTHPSGGEEFIDNYEGARRYRYTHPAATMSGADMGVGQKTYRRLAPGLHDVAVVNETVLAPAEGVMSVNRFRPKWSFRRNGGWRTLMFEVGQGA